MLNKFLSTVEKYDMISAGDKVVAAVSGGADSMCMLLLLMQARDALDFTLCVAHVNHMIRGEEADSDELFVRNFCRENNIEYYCKKINIPELSKEKSLSTELVARQERYKFFESLGCDKIATAHTVTDSIETMLMNLSRGSGLNGLTSIPPVRGNIIRPVIDFNREETESFCKINNVQFVTDSTNNVAEYTRNKFRINVIPQIKNAINSFDANAKRCMQLLSRDNDYISGESDLLFDVAFSEADNSLNVICLTGKHPALVSRVVMRYLTQFTNSDFEQKHIDYILNNIDNCFSLTLPGNLTIKSDSKKIFILQKQISVSVSDPVSFSKNENVSVIFNGYTVNCFPCDNSENFSGKGVFLTNFYALGDKITLRSRLPGDSIRLPGRGCTKSLKKLFNENKTSLTDRQRCIIVCDDKGIIAVGGASVDASRTAKNTDRFYVISIKETE